MKGVNRGDGTHWRICFRQRITHRRMKGFAEDEDIKSQENADLCFKALQTFLK